jgi:hypothetical protein
MRVLTVDCYIIIIFKSAIFCLFFCERARYTNLKTNPMPISADCLLTQKKSPTILQLMKSHFGNFYFHLQPNLNAQRFSVSFFSIATVSHMIRYYRWLEKEACKRLRVAQLDFAFVLARSKLKKSSRCFYISIQSSGEIYLEWFEK